MAVSQSIHLCWIWAVCVQIKVFKSSHLLNILSIRLFSSAWQPFPHLGNNSHPPQSPTMHTSLAPFRVDNVYRSCFSFYSELCSAVLEDLNKVPIGRDSLPPKKFSIKVAKKSIWDCQWTYSVSFRITES